ncbi:ChaC-like protein [Pseudovirgaria hyperparasitica]|uniref:glutathione-specific gamma-glutamylcyclotransferase n=1 Tax=Pseudovirgaria hyperparasitica TaxID=470096 RepID=A0A6A6W6E4_9PEZI|nr:ChaC-like protein [Pseudovirgaria hyperparasitica]KAF2756641.1 ChaC-like protein [Pseudovirgaria hyperparasitica]
MVDESKFAENFWLFGYGSLIWKPPPHFDKRVPGFIEGYVRRFWQASEDHRGTPNAPGRVVTLIDHNHWMTLSAHDLHKSTTSTKVWGAAYHIPPQHVAEVREYLDIREINGYSIQYTPFHPTDSSSPPIHCLVYIGLPDNPQFLGAQEPEALANHILRSSGPSGANKEYLYMLETALDGLSMDSGDEHVSDLARRCRRLEGVDVDDTTETRKEVEEELMDPGMTDGKEETEK